jgi:prolyl-tRNA editing enzyme YbaK/EbsC (Cys-tRNA(Pro) deacylase)
MSAADATAELPASARRVQQALAALGFTLEVRTFAESTRTSAEAAAAVGCTVAQIAKSLVFRRKRAGTPLLVIASGANRVDEKKLAAALGEPVARPDADYVRGETGYAIGGIPPVGHDRRIETLIDDDLLALGEIWAAAGTPNAVFRLTPADLVAMTGGRVMDLKQRQS